MEIVVIKVLKMIMTSAITLKRLPFQSAYTYIWASCSHIHTNKARFQCMHHIVRPLCMYMHIGTSNPNQCILHIHPSIHLSQTLQQQQQHWRMLFMGASSTSTFSTGQHLANVCRSPIISPICHCPSSSSLLSGYLQIDDGHSKHSIMGSHLLAHDVSIHLWMWWYIPTHSSQVIITFIHTSIHDGWTGFCGLQSFR